MGYSGENTDEFSCSVFYYFDQFHKEKFIEFIS